MPAWSIQEVSVRISDFIFETTFFNLPFRRSYALDNAMIEKSVLNIFLSIRVIHLAKRYLAIDIYSVWFSRTWVDSVKSLD